MKIYQAIDRLPRTKWTESDEAITQALRQGTIAKFKPDSYKEQQSIRDHVHRKFPQAVVRSQNGFLFVWGDKIKLHLLKKDLQEAATISNAI